jgi:hypothetical protein
MATGGGNRIGCRVFPGLGSPGLSGAIAAIYADADCDSIKHYVDSPTAGATLF